MESQIKEIAQFLTLQTRPDIKLPAIEFIAGLTGSSETNTLIARNTTIIDAAVNLTKDEIENVADAAYITLINVTGDDHAANYLCKKDYVQSLLLYALKKTAKYADKACMILCNLTRLSQGCDTTMEILQSQDGRKIFNQLLDAFFCSGYNKHATYHHVAAILANVTQVQAARRWILDKDKLIIQKCLPYTQYYDNAIRRRGLIAVIKNCCFESDCNEWLLGEEIDILPHLLLPLAGPEELKQEETDRLPLDLQYLGEDKVREPEADLRIMLIESLMQLCATKPCRMYIREKMAYAILRELHQWDKNEDVLSTCEKLIQILIGDEPEAGMEDLRNVTVPDNYSITDKSEAIVKK
ncbi:uncharacterized protein TRIADDRAFT_19950 [Trichoplax adhaerens]|uniref:Protein HGH1 homolog n=1 Tax=Trichoplax adhaerens TaxID=10228 RepID=B3RJZ9_TRIAD|nr:hypothetical protein TRIADDRAFT_19950 [Trichoplax adhaerens]EDV29347.1 hypothetical protein TRIADDRAFT_19950 [Trichoplax adhaerens]|eukprot:XP_002108549.1 hypothetical protein TRIADDRAFT_19950 [Trichoplax adhaerens]